MANSNQLSTAALKRLLEASGMASRIDPVELHATMKTRGSPVSRINAALDRLNQPHIRAVQTACELFDPANAPALAFVNQRWMLLVRETDEGLVMVDLESEAREPFYDDSGRPLGVCIWLSETPNAAGDATTSETNSARLILDAALKDKRWLADVTLATVTINGFAVLTSFFAMQIYDRVVPTLAFNTLYALSIGVTVVYLIDLILKVQRSKILDRHSSAIDKIVSKYIFEHITSCQLDKIPPSLGTLTAQINGLESARQFFSSSIVFLLVDLPFALFFLFVIYTIGGPISAVYLLAFAISLLVAYIAQRNSQRLTKTFIVRSNERTGLIVDTIKGMETIRTSGAARFFVREWETISDSISSNSVAQKHINSLATYVTSLITSLAYVLGIIVGVELISEGKITQGALVASSMLGGRILGPISQTVGYLIQYESVRQGMDMVNKLLQIPADRPSGQMLVNPDVRPTRIELEQISFVFPGSKTKQISIESLQFEAGERVALLGKIGSGKSTLLKLIAGLYKPSEGRVRIDQINLSELDPHFLSRTISYVPQNVDLFKGTLVHNVTLGNEAGGPKLVQIVEMLGLNEIASQSDKGMNRLVSEGGMGLSGGQRQMVGLARAFANEPTIWLLDEPTSSLDGKSQAQFVDALKSQMRKSDILVFATHNPQLAKLLGTRLIIMDGGKIVNDIPASSVEVKQS